MAGIHGNPIEVFSYDLTKIDFRRPIKDALGLNESDELAMVHERFDKFSVVDRENDSKTPIHQRYYENVHNTNFYSQYRKFIRDVIVEAVGEPIIVQKVPSFRVHLPGNKAVGEYHRDKDFGHQDAAINFWVPVTNAYQSNTLHVVSDDGHPKPIEARVGEAVAFDAVNLRHGNEINDTGKTRVSFDFRVIPEADYVESTNKSVNTMTQLALGGYYVHQNFL